MFAPRPSRWIPRLRFRRRPEPLSDLDMVTIVDDDGHVRVRAVSVDAVPSPAGGRIVRVTPGPMDARDEAQMRQHLGLPADPGRGLSLEQLDQAENWYRERLQTPPAWIRERRAELLITEADEAPRLTARALEQARATGQQLDDLHDAFEERLAAIDDRIAKSAARALTPPDKPAEGDLLTRIDVTVDGPPSHTHTWDQRDRDGRHNWACACSAVKCDLPRCIRARHDQPPHHIDRS